MSLFQRHHPLLPALAALVLFVAPGAARADQTIDTTPRPTGVASGQGLVAYSAYDPAIHAYRLMIARDGHVERASVRPSPTPFDVDIGPTQSGRAYLVYSRCESRDTPVPKGCDIYAYDPDSHHENRYDASSPTESDVHPTYWRGRIAFVRYYGSGDDPRPIVYTRRAHSSQPSQRLPGLPADRCLKYAGCGPVTGTIDELELYGDHLAQTAATVSHVGYDRRQTEVRLVSVHSGRSQQIAARGSGESGQEFVGLSFRAGRLLYVLHLPWRCRRMRSWHRRGLPLPLQHGRLVQGAAHRPARRLLGVEPRDDRRAHERRPRVRPYRRPARPVPRRASAAVPRVPGDVETTAVGARRLRSPAELAGDRRRPG